MQLHLSTWQEVDSYLQRSTAILLPIGSTEQHGPNGLIGTDAICPEVIAREAGDEGDILVGPTFNVGCAQHHLGFAGSMTLRPSTMIAVMVDWTRSLRRHGFTRIYWLNGHGGNIATINAAFAEIYAEGSFAKDEVAADSGAGGLRQKTANWWELPGIFKLCTDIYPEGHGAHATASEVAVTQYAYPKHIKRVRMEPKIAPMGQIHDAAQYARDFPDGRIGSDPAQATPEDGKRIVKAAAAALIEDFSAFARS